MDEESSYLTTFYNPSGHYRYLWAPMGLLSSSDEWCWYSDFVIEKFEFAKKIVDYILIWAETHTLECALDKMTHLELITQIVLMHCPVKDIKNEAKKEKEQYWQKMTEISEDYDRTNIGEWGKHRATECKLSAAQIQKLTP